MLHLIKEIWSKCNKTVLVIGIIETGLIVFLSAKLIFSHPAPQIKTQDVEKQYQDSIAVLKKQYQLIEQDKAHLQHVNDSLAYLKTNIQIVYNEKIKYVERAPIDTVYSFIKSYLHSTKQ